jgi:hypothetical protein
MRKISEFDTVLATYETRFTAIYPILQSVKDLHARLQSMEQAIQNRHTSPNPLSMASADPWLQNFAHFPGAMNPLNASHPTGLTTGPVPHHSY